LGGGKKNPNAMGVKSKYFNKSSKKIFISSQLFTLDLVCYYGFWCSFLLLLSNHISSVNGFATVDGVKLVLHSFDFSLNAKSGTKKKRPKDMTITVNRNAYRNYEIMETLEAGISLVGTEVKSIRDGKMNIRDGFCKPDRRGTCTLHNVRKSRFVLLYYILLHHDVAVFSFFF
jgi:hypothetical protein